MLATKSLSKLSKNQSRCLVTTGVKEPEPQAPRPHAPAPQP